jgi:hypothetical protein
MRSWGSTSHWIVCSFFVVAIGLVGCCPPYDLNGPWVASGSCIDDPATPEEESVPVDVSYTCPTFSSTSSDWMNCTGVVWSNTLSGSCSGEGGGPFICDLIIRSGSFLSGACTDGHDVCTLDYSR